MSRRTLPAAGAVPTPAQVRAMREAAADTQVAAAERVYASPRTWQAWEQGTRAMPAGLAELYLLKTRLRELPTPGRTVYERHLKPGA